jgi:hypothetical protein
VPIVVVLNRLEVLAKRNIKTGGLLVKFTNNPLTTYCSLNTYYLKCPTKPNLVYNNTSTNLN